jgi:poly-gamma-glutamate capsule biosynthesis protein CapA/YwtB (metallophosphatase superfamily)
VTRNEPVRNDPPGAATPRQGGGHTARITRRTLLSVAAAATVAGCASPIVHQKPTPTATRFSLYRAATLATDGTVPPTLAQSAQQRLTSTAGLSEVAFAKQGDAADLMLTYGALPSGYVAASVGASAATLLTHLRVPLDNITASQAKALLAGAVTNWSAVGAPASLPARPFKLAGLPTPTGVSLPASATSAPNVASLLTALRGQPGSFALAPLESADWSLRNLGVDGWYPAQGRGNANAPAFPPFTLTIGVSQSLAKQGLVPHALAAVLAPLLASAQTTVDVAVVGDIMLGRGVNNQMVARGDYLFPYRAIHDELHAADLRVANLECTITDLVPVPTDPATFTFVSSAKAVNGLTYAGFDVLTVANNHSNGSGPGALLDMLNTLHTHGIKSCGGGRNIGEARAPAIHEANGVRIAILGYDIIPPQGPFATAAATGLAPIDLTTLPDDVNAARAQADLVLPYFHWGIEYTKDPTQEQQQIARAAIDAGADMVLGNHPHWTQGIETYKGRLIVYSFGNFIFDQDWSRPTQEGMLLHLYWRGATLAGIRFVPVIDVSRCQPRIMNPNEAQDLFARMWSGTDLLASGHYGPEPE